MSVRASDVKKTRAARAPYTPPAARRSAGGTAISDKKVEAFGAAAKGLARQDSRSSGGQQGKAGTQPRQQRAAEDGNEEARRSRAVAKGEIARVNTGTAENRGGEGGCSDVERDSGETGRESAAPCESTDSGNTCQPTPTTPDSNDTSPPKVVAAAPGSRRKPRQAWSQYVPPGRRGAGSNESVRSSVPAATVDISGRGSSGGVSSRPALNQEATPHRSSTVVVDEPAAAAADEQTTSAATTTSSSLSEPCDVDGNETVASKPEEEQASCSAHAPLSSPPPPSFHAESSNRLAAREPTGTTPSPVAACEERQDGRFPAAAAAAAAAATDAVETPCKEPTNGTKISELAENVADHDRDELPPFKAPSARYVPPGRRKALDAEAAAAAAKGGNGDGAAGDGMGPLWTSRAPVCVSQRERASDRDTSPARPSPARVAGVVSGGMSAYGANISEYSEEMSREQVEACTAVVSNFPAALPPGQREPMLQPFVSLGGLVVWPRPDEALVTFATPALARQAVSARNNRSTVLLVELLSQTREEKRVGYRRVELARPGRPPADISSGSRLILGALGIRRPKPKMSDAAPTRKSANSKGGVRGRGAKNVQAPPAESTDSWDM